MPSVRDGGNAVMSSPEPVIYAYSVKLESTAKGLVMPTVHVYGNDMEKCRKEAIEQFHKTVEELRAKNIVTASEGKA
jgi:hypothetical protein